MRTATEQFGPTNLLVNCAAIFPGATLDDFSWSDYDSVLQINLAAPIEACLAWAELQGPSSPAES